MEIASIIQYKGKIIPSAGNIRKEISTLPRSRPFANRRKRLSLQTDRLRISSVPVVKLRQRGSFPFSVGASGEMSLSVADTYILIVKSIGTEKKPARQGAGVLRTFDGLLDERNQKHEASEKNTKWRREKRCTRTYVKPAAMP